ncbi:MAG: WYL domain-containing protein [Cellulomonadaceae bacterium]|jgi:proteasome accessory factor B|nr:WYL domain-containing protein [Cellulomonadaceae bacterium]
MASRKSAVAQRMTRIMHLLEASGGMTKAQLLEVEGLFPGKNSKARERMLNYDFQYLTGLDLLRGRPNRQTTDGELVYSLVRPTITVPPVDLTQQELAVIELAARSCGDDRIASEVSRALDALDPSSNRVGDDPEPDREHQNYIVLAEAAERRRCVSFLYDGQNTGKATARSKVQPWDVFARDGAWYVHGWDPYATANAAGQKRRTFRISRIASTVTVSGKDHAFPIPPVVDHARALGEEPERFATLAVKNDRGHVLRARGTLAPGVTVPHGFEAVKVPFAHTERMADEVASFGDAVIVVDPADVKAGVMARLTAAARWADAQQPSAGGATDEHC